MKKIVLTIILCVFYATVFTATSFTSQKEFSSKAWEKSSKVVVAIIQHPFNQELMHGNLPRNKFNFYIEQDDIYLEEYARCLAMIAAKMEPEYAKIFLKYAESTLKIEKNQLHKYFKDHFHIKETGEITPTTLSYTSYLLRVAATEPVEVAVAAILPCFWVYREVGLSLNKGSQPNNPYRPWIETYSNPKFNQDVNEMITIFNHLASHTTEAIRNKMLEAFYTSTLYEWYFWDDVYYERIFGIK